MRTQTMWAPTSSGPVLQQPSRKKPVTRIGAARLQLTAEDVAGAGVPSRVVSHALMIVDRRPSRAEREGRNACDIDQGASG